MPKSRDDCRKIGFTLLTVTSAYKVVVVVDREFGKRLAALPSSVPVWMVESAANRAAARERWGERPDTTHLTGVTIFKATDLSPEDILLAQLETIDLHHGLYSAEPPYTVLEVVGTHLSERIKRKLSQYGFDESSATDVGFSATRALPKE